MSSMHPKGWMVEKPSRDPACPGSAVPACRAQEKFPDKSGKYMSPVHLPALTEADVTGARLRADVRKNSTKAFFRIPCVGGSPGGLGRA